MQPRSQQDWIEELRGQRGVIKQRLALIELERYLNRVGYNIILRAKAPGRPKFADILAQFIQNDLAELEQHRGKPRVSSVWPPLPITGADAAESSRPYPIGGGRHHLAYG